LIGTTTAVLRPHFQEAGMILGIPLAARRGGAVDVEIITENDIFGNPRAPGSYGLSTLGYNQQQDCDVSEYSHGVPSTPPSSDLALSLRQPPSAATPLLYRMSRVGFQPG